MDVEEGDTPVAASTTTMDPQEEVGKNNNNHSYVVDNHHHHSSGGGMMVEDDDDNNGEVIINNKTFNAASASEVVSDGDAEVHSINVKAEEEEQETLIMQEGYHSPSSFPPRKVSRRSKDSTSSSSAGRRKSSSSPNRRTKNSTPNSITSTSGMATPTKTSSASTSDREENMMNNLYSPANSINLDNPPPTNGSMHNDTFGDGERSDKTESGDSHCASVSSFLHTNGPSQSQHNSSSHPSSSSNTLSKRNVSLPMLLAGGILKPGEGTMSLEYHGQKFTGDLLETGQIKSVETSAVYSSPSAWALACKQIINPDKGLRKSGCGWASIKYRGLKLDYYKTVWAKRVREGSIIDARNLVNGASGGDSSEEEDEEATAAPFTVLRFGEHLDGHPSLQSAQAMGSKILIACSRFSDLDRLQPFYVKVTASALALADFHCSITDSESLGYISGRWSSDHNCLTMDTVHPCQILLSGSSPSDCDLERNRIALEIQRMGHVVAGWYHSHPAAPPFPSRDDIARQLDAQLVMKGASESSYVPCVGVVISPLTYSVKEDLGSSQIQFFWVLPPGSETRPSTTDLLGGRPMHVDYDKVCSVLDIKALLIQMGSLVQFYKEKASPLLLDVNEDGPRFARLQESFTSILPETTMITDFWDEVKALFNKSPPPPPPQVQVSSKPKEETEEEEEEEMPTNPFPPATTLTDPNSLHSEEDEEEEEQSLDLMEQDSTSKRNKSIKIEIQDVLPPPPYPSDGVGDTTTGSVLESESAKKDSLLISSSGTTTETEEMGN